MTLQKLGKNISEVEVSNISKHGFWLFVNEKEYFLPYDEYPWFKDAKVSDILNVTLLHKFHLYWGKLDIDLEVSSLDNLNHYPLIYK
ncbi:MAG: DUF2442 domain-containing protein [Candidatus Marinimicrobia bacterium]|nr:DUF2442 domain-containing protein [Candidatus Neomarinimicrobiota bacterium]